MVWGKYRAKGHDSSDPNTRHVSDWAVNVCIEELECASARWCAGYLGTNKGDKKIRENYGN